MSALWAPLAVVSIAVAVQRVFLDQQRVRARRRLASNSALRAPQTSTRWSASLARIGLDPQSPTTRLAAVVVLGALVLFVGLVPVVVVVGVGLVGYRHARGRSRANELRKIVAALPAALDDLARSLRSGSSLPLALGHVASTVRGPLAVDWSRIQRSLDLGTRLGDAATEWAQARPCPEVRLAVSAWRLGIESGGSLAASLAGIATTLRARAETAAEVRALSSQARLSALIIGVAPVAFCGLASRADPRLAHTLFATSIGWVLLALGLGLDLAGALWMRRLARVA